MSAGYSSCADTVKNIEFHVDSGEIVGIIGNNGAGKSTIIKAILGLTPSISGNVHICSYSMENQARQAKKHTGYIPEVPLVYSELTLREHLMMIAAMYGMDGTAYENSARELLRSFHLEGKIDYFPSEFSKGMQQKVMIICAMLHRPSLYIIDEPFVGLDPLATRTFTGFLFEERSRGAGILMSTHILDSAEKICDRFIIMSGGRMIAQGTMSQLCENFGHFESLLDLYIHVSGLE
ncbi:ABC transporter, ATP-binding protein EcsA [Desulfocucumis palustris]|uniref:ABC transporter, ATP-binding protein EcsA n=1 Tax=Desulfocucumis palustris TaxID=1898651 RepID=A0A2L2XI19_9FIRM|nr:ABC transporter, ATP-binding protein EcsA [Desulfocucumis palustris]